MERCKDRLEAMRIMYRYALENEYLEEFYAELEYKFTNLFYQTHRRLNHWQNLLFRSLIDAIVVALLAHGLQLGIQFTIGHVEYPRSYIVLSEENNHTTMGIDCMFVADE